MTPRKPLDEKFWAKVDRSGSGGCWIWTGACTGRDDAYGRFYVERRPFQAHRWSYERFVGPIPEGLVLDHLCRVTRCVNPDHLEPVTYQENSRRGLVGALERARTHCPSGHPYAGENLYIGPSDGKRRCRACLRASRRRYREKGRLERQPSPETTDREGQLTR